MQQSEIPKADVREMFNDISPRYDLLNRLLSLGIDRIWRKRLIRKINATQPTKVLDVATGTADLAIMLAKRNSNVEIDGIDISEGMLAIGAEKIKKKKFDHRINLTLGSAEALPFQQDMYDACMIGFGIRNFENPLAALKEIYRTLTADGQIGILEFTTPRYFPIKNVYIFYFEKVLPWLGRRVSGHKTAYSYLPASVKQFKEREEFLELLRNAQFQEAKYKALGWGIVGLYTAKKGSVERGEENIKQ